MSQVPLLSGSCLGRGPLVLRAWAGWEDGSAGCRNPSPLANWLFLPKGTLLENPFTKQKTFLAGAS